MTTGSDKPVHSLLEPRSDAYMHPENTPAFKPTIETDSIRWRYIPQISAVVMALLLFLVIKLHLVPAAFIGMLIFLLTRALGDAVLARFIRLRRQEKHCRMLVTALVATLLVFGVVELMRTLSSVIGNQENLAGLAEQVSSVLMDLREKLPTLLVSYLPESLLDLKTSLVALIREHSSELTKVGKESLHTLAHVLIALAIGLMLSLHHFVPLQEARPFARVMRQRFSRLSQAYANVVFAQVKISAINTVFTGIFILLAMPLAGVHLPYAKTLVIITFVAGLMPIVGNLVSNSLITVVALGVSFHVALAALAFLVGIHKLEYFINAKIIGDRVQAKAWELLLAMLGMEAMFGVPGLLLAPIIYAYIKSELLAEQLV